MLTATQTDPDTSDLTSPTPPRPNGAKVAANLHKFATDCDEKANLGDALAFLWQVRGGEALAGAIQIEKGGDPAEIIGHLSDDTLRALAAFKNIAV